MNDRKFIANSWMGRRSVAPPLQPGKPFVPMAVDKPSGRHAVIRTQLPNWHSYRSWVDKARGNWEQKK